MKIKYATAIAVAVASSAFQASAQRVWDGETDGDWTNATNWDGNATAPASGNALNFGLATNYTVTNSPATNFGALTFLSTAGANYTLSGNTANNPLYGNITVEGSSSATNHTINNAFRVQSKTFDIQSTQTSLTVTAQDYAQVGGIFTKNGAGLLIFAGGGQNAGGLNMNGGTVDFQQGLSAANGQFRINGADSSAVVTNSTVTARTLQFAHDPAAAASYAGSITGNLSLVNGRTNGGGTAQTFTSTSANTYTGTTTVNTGSFIVNGTHTGGGNYMVRSRIDAAGDGTLGGSGTVVLSVSTNTFALTGNAVDRLAVLRPGADGIDTTTMTLGSTGINTTVNLNNFSVMRLDVGAGGTSDMLAVFGDLNINAGSTLDLLGLGGAFDGSSYTLATFTGTRTGTFGTVTGLQNGYGIVYGANSITLIPEPSTFAMLLGGMGLLFLRRR